MPIALDPTFLDARQVPSGGYAPFPGEPARADATAWALLAGRPACQGRAEDWEFLASNQEPSGAVVLLPEGRKSGWVTSVAILAWLASGQAPEAAEKAVRYLLEMGGEKRDVPQPSIVAHDVNLRGWPWIEGTFPWVDTTALALVALRAADRSREERFREGKKLLLNRQLPSGGWNYGNTMVYGAELRPTPESTGAALFALAGETSEQEVDCRIRNLVLELLER